MNNNQSVRARRARPADLIRSACNQALENLEHRQMLTVNPVIVYQFNEGTGLTTVDASAEGGLNNGTLVSDFSLLPTWGTGSASPAGGSYLTFNGDSLSNGQGGRVDTASPLSTVLGNTSTVSYWIRTSATGADAPWNAPAVTGVEVGASGNDIFLGSITANGSAKAQAGDGANAVTRSPINDGNWHHVVHTYDAVSGQLRTYLDGSLSSTVTSQTGPKTTDFNSIGALVQKNADLSLIGYNYLNGDLDQIEMFDRVLSPQEVAQRYGPTSTEVPAAPVVTAQSNALRAITISWNDVPNASGYVISRSLTGEAGSYTEIALVGADSTAGPTTTFTQSNLTAGQEYFYEVVAFGQAGNSNPGRVSMVAPATGNGMSAHYYNTAFWGAPIRPGQDAFTTNDPNKLLAHVNAPVNTLIGTELDFNWGTGSPAAGIPADNFSTAFTGKIVPTESGDHYILGYGDDDTAVFVNGALVSYDPLGHGIPGNNQAGFDSVDMKNTINLTAGVEYDVVVLQAEGGGGAGVQLRWITPTMLGDTFNTSTSALVPVTSLRTATGAPDAATNLTNSVYGGGIVAVSFTDNSTNELHYVLERSSNGSAFVPVEMIPIVQNPTDGSPGSGYYESKVTEAGTYTYRLRGVNFDGVTVSTATTTAVVDEDMVVTGPGVQGYYFNTQFWGSVARPADGQISVDLTPDYTETVPDINVNWGDGATTPGSPEPGIINNDNFSTVFVSKFVAPETGTYSILAFSDDDSYVWVNGQLVSADPGGHGAPANTAAGIATIDVRNTIDLVAGQEYNLVAIQSEGGGGAAMHLRWILPSDTDKNNASDIPASAYVSNIANAGPGALANGAPAAATNVRVEDSSRQGTFVTLQWNDVATNELTYTIERTGPGGVVTLINLPINTTSYTDTGLATSTQYSYRVIASNFQGTTASTSMNVTTRVANEVPAGPLNAVAVSRANGVRVAFTDNSATENEFIILRAPVTGGTPGTFAEVGRVAGTAPTIMGGRFAFTDTTAVAGEVYAYHVVAVNGAGNSAPTNTVQITYTAPTGTGVRATYFSTINFQGTPIVLPNPIDLDENWGENGPAELVADAGDTDPDDTISTRFEGYITPEFTETYNFWTGSDDGIALQVIDPETGEVLINYDNLGARRGIVATGFQDNAGTADLVAGKKYAIIVRVVEDQGGFAYRVGWSSPSLPQEVLPTELLTAPTGTETLLAPVAISAAAVGTEKVTVTFNPQLANFTETGFEILRSTTGAPGSFTLAGTTGADATQFVDNTSLVLGQTYYYVVRAVRNGAPGAESNVVSAVTGVGGTGVTLGGTAAILPGGELQITDNVNDRLGTAFTTNARPIETAGMGTDGSTGFNTSFNFTIPEGSRNADLTPNMADGFAFVIQRNTPTSAGAGGGGLGYTGVGNSIAVEFDFYNAVNQVGVYANGYDVGNDVAGNSQETGFVFENGHTYKVDIGYNAGTNEMSITLTDLTDTASTPLTLFYNTARTGTAAAPVDETLDITQLTGGQQAFFGFTGATGGLNADQRITNWTINGEVIPFVITDNQWTGGPGGTGTDVTQGGNWQTGAAPSGPTATAKFGGADANAGNVDVNTNVTVGDIVFDSSNPYNVQGTGTITLGDAGNAGGINVVTGTHTIGNAIVAPGGLDITLEATAGGLTVGDVSGDVTVTGNGKTVTTGAITDGSLTVNAGTNVKIAQGSDVSVVDAITLSGGNDAWTGLIDITDNGLVVRSTAATREADYARIMNMIAAGLNLNGASFWSGTTGITSSLAAADEGGLRTAVGAIINDYDFAGLGVGPVQTDFGGVAVGVNDILIKYTYFGDADLNGMVDGGDFFLIDNAYSNNVVNGGWLNGDFDYNGTIDGGDFFLIDNGFASQDETLSSNKPVAAITSADAAPATSSTQEESLDNVFASQGSIGGQAVVADADDESDDDDEVSLVASSDLVL